MQTLNENGLTIKQQMFCNEYLSNGLNAKAAYQAVYTKANDKTAMTNSFKLKNTPEVKEYIEKKLKEIEDAKIASAKERMQFYSSVLRGEETEEVIFMTEDGVEKVSKKATIKDRLRAGEMLDKIEDIGSINKQEITITQFMSDAFNQLFGVGDEEDEEEV